MQSHDIFGTYLTMIPAIIFVSLITKKRGSKEALKVIERALLVTGKNPTEIRTDGLGSYVAALNQLKINTKHVANVGIKDKKNNNRMERLHNTIRGWQRTKRGFHKESQLLIDGYRNYYDYMRPNMALNDLSPSKLLFERWSELLLHASAPKK